MTLTDFFRAKALASLRAIAEEYDPTHQYHIGDFCIHDGKLYVCVSDTTGTWDSTAWTQASVMGTLAEKIDETRDMIAATFDPTETYSAGDYTVYGDYFYVFTNDHTGPWDGTDASTVTVSEILGDISSELDGHVANADIHVTTEDKQAWNGAVENIGTLSSLTTTEKSNLVGAINELDGDLSHLPSPAADDGTYVITQHNDNMELTDFDTAGIGEPSDLDVDGADTIVEAVNIVDENLQSLNDQIVLNSLDGTKAKYNTMMKQWFIANGVNAMTPEGITALCERWYTITRNGWDGYTEFALPDESAVSSGTKGGDNAGLTCTPSTDAAANTDDYAGNPLFACTDINYVVDATTLDIVVTAIDGITDNFVRNDPTKFVGVMQMSGWHYYYDTETTYVHGYADHQVNTGTCEPLPESVRVDGTIRKFVVHSKYMSKTVDGKMTSCAGLIPTAYTVSHNSLHTMSAANGVQYSGGTIIDNSFLILMTYIKYASLTLDGILQGCCSYNYQYYAQVAETGVKRVLVAQANGANIVVGSSLLIGNYGGNADRGQAAMYSISGQKGCIVTSVEDVTINDTTYKAIYVDADTAFDTVVNGDATNGTTVISTFHWPTGTCDSVLGNDGSPVSASSGKFPAKLQGIEYAVGAYEVYADVILNIATDNEVSYYTPYVVKRSANQATSITANYTGLSDLRIECPASDGWRYIKREGFKSGVFSPVLVDGSSSTYTRDAMYMNKQGTTGTREWLAFGHLNSGSGAAGLSCLRGDYALGFAAWGFSARLSPNGNRGEWAA